ncbi:MAG: STAS/SEC14 domain-containing protein [Spongiibacter sp.]|uniref:STAS/SEC14 domain-containing protein n=1 Tax=Spongiibacter thalassae TaxID=2721624 RepID=A0ABX1GJ01_9GAMM|nr:STAS/SEC14 domain-containing protein [Spongiibacter thalassae]NKI18327.1 STAS/SEC14 domain-containing protein [Spongiibacter thalassae]
MLELLPIPIGNVVGVKVSGKVNHQDMERVLVEVKRKLKDHESLGVYIELDHFKGFTLRGLLKEMRLLSCFLGHFTRTALVSDTQWYRRAAQIITHWTPNIEIEHFTPIQHDEALIWVSERDVGAFSG